MRGRLRDCHTLHTLLLPISMSESASHLGSCPFCGAELRAGAVLIKYEVGDETRAFAECSRCDEPVRPQ
jgi:hypothetical protein